jgi:hypothetical protein
MHDINFFIYNELFAIRKSIELSLMLHEFIVVMNFAFNMGRNIIYDRRFYPIM